jgi:hypothetical protein
MKSKNLFSRKNLKFFRSSLRNKSTSAEAELWNILKSKNVMQEHSEDNIN